MPAHSFLYSTIDRTYGHLRRYDRRGLISILRDSGFEPILFWSYGSILFHLIGNMSAILNREGLKRHDEKEPFERTKKSATREFPPIFHIFVSKVNLLHRAFLALDDIFKKSDIGVEYFVLCKSKERL